VVPALSLTPAGSLLEEEPIKSRPALPTSFTLVGDGPLSRRTIGFDPSNELRLLANGQYMPGVENLEISVTRDFMEVGNALPFSRVPLLADYYLEANGALCDWKMLAGQFEENAPLHVAIIPPGASYLIEGNMLITRLELHGD
jgi:hypothetical protein